MRHLGTFKTFKTSPEGVLRVLRVTVGAVFRENPEHKEAPMKRRKPKLPPWSRHHEPWCAVYRGKSCDCDDDGNGPGRHRPVSGGDAPAPERERELEDA
jgi:hypothetical protein